MTDLTPIDLSQRLPDILLRINDLIEAHKELSANTFPVEFVQMNPEDRWDITHQFPRHPVVSVFDSSGQLVWADVDYPTPTLIVVSFSGAMAGTAILT